MSTNKKHMSKHAFSQINLYLNIIDRGNIIVKTALYISNGDICTKVYVNTVFTYNIFYHWPQVVHDRKHVQITKGGHESNS